jgi:hypothetical protein
MAAGVTAKDLCREQEERRRRIEMKEMEANTTCGARAAFARKPYFTRYGGEYRERLAEARRTRHCKECGYFEATGTGARGACRGHCTGRHSGDTRPGSRPACKYFRAVKNYGGGGTHGKG